MAGQVDGCKFEQINLGDVVQTLVLIIEERARLLELREDLTGTER